MEVTCPADNIPEGFDLDLTGLDVGDSIHFSSITLPEGTKPTITDRDFTIATIAAPSALRSEEGSSDDDEGAEEGEGGGEEKDGDDE
jgi:large subunit ribosomal protein L25